MRGETEKQVPISRFTRWWLFCSFVLAAAFFGINFFADLMGSAAAIHADVFVLIGSIVAGVLLFDDEGTKKSWNIFTLVALTAIVTVSWRKGWPPILIGLSVAMGIGWFSIHFPTVMDWIRDWWDDDLPFSP